MFVFLVLHIHFGLSLTFHNVFGTEPAFLHYIVIDESYTEIRHAKRKLYNKYMYINSMLDEEICLLKHGHRFCIDL